MLTLAQLVAFPSSSWSISLPFPAAASLAGLAHTGLDAGLQGPAPVSVQGSANALLCRLCQHPGWGEEGPAHRCGAEPLTAAAPLLCSPRMALLSPILGTWRTGTLPHLGPWVAEGSGSSHSRLQRGKSQEGQGCPPRAPLLTQPNHTQDWLEIVLFEITPKSARIVLLSVFVGLLFALLPLFKSFSSLSLLLLSFSTPLFCVLFFKKFRQVRNHLTFTLPPSPQNVSLDREALSDFTDTPRH